MPNLEWAGKAEAVQAAKNAPYRLLLADERLSYGDLSTGNAIVQGDNLDALKSLLPYYAGRVRCVYIDPPYNTHSAFEHYDDSVEHSTWLSLMYPRLELLREFLAEDGSIWISIDDRECHYLKVLCDEIFGRSNFIANVVWEKKYSPQNAAKWLSDSHDHILCYARHKEIWHPNLLQRTDEMNARYTNRDNDPRGVWKPSDATAQAGHGTATQFYVLHAPNGKEYTLPSGRCWLYTEPVMLAKIADNRIWFGKSGTSVPQVKKFLSEVKQGISCKTLWFRDEVGDNQEGKREIKELFKDDVFDTPKPERLIQRILQLATNPGDFVLDSFLGSGTTAAVAQKMGRQYIGVEIGEHATTHVVPRMKKVIDGEAGGISKEENWTGGGGFVFYRLGEALFDEDGSLQKGAPFYALAAHIWHAETDTAYVGCKDEKAATGEVGEARPIYGHVGENSLLGVHKGVAYYLLYNGVLGDKRPQGGNVLTRKVLRMLPPYDGPKIIFGESCRIQDEGLKELKITFRQTPSAVKK